MAKSKEATKPVLVTTIHKGVFMGYIPDGVDMDVKSIRIEKARMAVYWSSDVRGVIGLAANGPTKGCRIGPPAPAITLHDVTAVVEMSPEAAALWEKTPWAS